MFIAFIITISHLNSANDGKRDYFSLSCILCTFKIINLARIFLLTLLRKHQELFILDSGRAKPVSTVLTKDRRELLKYLAWDEEKVWIRNMQIWWNNKRSDDEEEKDWQSVRVVKTMADGFYGDDTMKRWVALQKLPTYSYAFEIATNRSH